jgi:hypothetical protein
MALPKEAQKPRPNGQFWKWATGKGFVRIPSESDFAEDTCQPKMRPTVPEEWDSVTHCLPCPSDGGSGDLGKVKEQVTIRKLFRAVDYDVSCGTIA